LLHKFTNSDETFLAKQFTNYIDKDGNYITIRTLLASCSFSLIIIISIIVDNYLQKKSPVYSLVNLT